VVPCEYLASAIPKSEDNPLTANWACDRVIALPFVKMDPLEIQIDISIQHLHHFNSIAVTISALVLWFLGAAGYLPKLFARPLDGGRSESYQL
jgi:hypothetical protein